MIDFNSFDLTKRTVVIDADTLVYSSAAAQQKLQYTATNKHNGKAQIFEGIKIYKAWLEEHSLSADDFDLTNEVIITGEAVVGIIVQHGWHTVLAQGSGASFGMLASVYIHNKFVGENK